MLHVVTPENRRVYWRELRAMHAQRRRVFVDQLLWPLACEGDLEIDAFDAADPIYLLRLGEGGEVQASVRLLRTDQPHLMSEHFGHLCERAAPAGASIWEVTRFCPSPDLSPEHRRAIVGEMTAGVLEAGLLFGKTEVTFITGGALKPLALKAGWTVAQLGPTHRYHGDRITACVASIDVAGLQRVRARYGLSAPLLRYAPALLAA